VTSDYPSTSGRSWSTCATPWCWRRPAPSGTRKDAAERGSRYRQDERPPAGSGRPQDRGVRPKPEG
jgi:hypothetical protein